MISPTFIFRCPKKSGRRKKLTKPLRQPPVGHLPLTLAQTAGPVLAWGDFVTITLNFLIVAFCIFLLVKGMNALKRHEEAKPTLPPEPTAQEKLLTEIRDLLKSRA